MISRLEIWSGLCGALCLAACGHAATTTPMEPEVTAPEGTEAGGVDVHPALALYRERLMPLLDAEKQVRLAAVEARSTASLPARDLLCRITRLYRGFWLLSQALGWNGPANRLSFDEPTNQEVRAELLSLSDHCSAEARGARAITDCPAVSRTLEANEARNVTRYVPGLDFACDPETGGDLPAEDRALAIASLEAVADLSDSAAARIEDCTATSAAAPPTPDEVLDAVEVLTELYRLSLGIFDGLFYFSPSLGLDTDPELVAEGVVSTFEYLVTGCFQSTEDAACGENDEPDDTDEVDRE